MALLRGNSSRERQRRSDGLLRLALLSCVVGLLSGLVAVLFRLALEHADRWRDLLIERARGRGFAGFVLIIAGVACACAIAAWMVRRFAPHAVGSGIPHVEATVEGTLPQESIRLVPVKFVGGWLAIGSGLALGREGPSVQMGATIGTALGKALRLNAPDCVALLAAGAGAGLATAFNAPMAGTIFVLEELVRRFDTRIAIAALGASGAAIAISRLLIGQNPDFHVEPIPYPGIGSGLTFLALGAIAGLAGIAYNRAILGALALADRLRRTSVEFRAALVGAAVGALAWFAPSIVGGGDALTQRALSTGQLSAMLALIFATRFVLGAVSYSACTPGGLFAPMLTLGAQIGILSSALSHVGLPTAGATPVALAVVGMAAFFTAVVRAPITGIALVVELTGNFTLLLPMLAACFVAMLIPTLLGDKPIYDSLKDRTLKLEASLKSLPRTS